MAADNRDRRRGEGRHDARHYPKEDNACLAATGRPAAGGRPPRRDIGPDGHAQEGGEMMANEGDDAMANGGDDAMANGGDDGQRRLDLK